MGKALPALLATLALSAFHSPASADTLVVNGFGVGGWTSWETRNSNGLLLGPADTNPYAVTYFNVSPSTVSTASDTAIQKQINFMSEGQTLKAAGNQTLPPSPTGSLNGLGYVRLDGTSSNPSKSDLSYVDPQGIAAASALDNAAFSFAYRYYAQPYTTLRTLNLNITVTGTDGADYTFNFIQPGVTTGWNSVSLNSTSGTFSVSAKGGSALPGLPKSLQDWANDPTYGSLLFGSNSEVFRVGFTIGQSQIDAVEYIDSMQTSLLNGGDVIDFQGPSSGGNTLPAAPLPSAAAMGILTLGACASLSFLRKKVVKA